MNTNARIDALNAAIAESKATMYDLHLAEGAVSELLMQSIKRPYYTTSKSHAVEMQLAGYCVTKKWSWQELRMVWWVSPKTVKP